MRYRTRSLALGLLSFVGVLAAAVGFGMTPTDVQRVRTFADAVRGWQVRPDYRAVAGEYVTLGVDAMQARLCGISAGLVVMSFRSIPGLPEHLAANDTSATHYDAFSRGELSAYLHLASEQGFPDGVAMIERLGRQSPGDAEIVAFLAAFKLPVPTVADAGAVAGVRQLLADVGVQPLTVRRDVATSLQTHAGTVVTTTRAQQAAAFARFDDAIRAADPELWRSKQVNDFLAGIWAQGYGQIYLDGIEGFFRFQRFARFTFAAALVAIIVLLRNAARRQANDRAAASARISDSAGPVTA